MNDRLGDAKPPLIETTANVSIGPFMSIRTNPGLGRDTAPPQDCYEPVVVIRCLPASTIQLVEKPRSIEKLAGSL